MIDELTIHVDSEMLTVDPVYPPQELHADCKLSINNSPPPGLTQVIAALRS